MNILPLHFLNPSESKYKSIKISPNCIGRHSASFHSHTNILGIDTKMGVDTMLSKMGKGLGFVVSTQLC